MFGMKLKSWMESHLGRPRKSTTHQKNQKSSKDFSSIATPSSSTTESGSGSTTAANNSTTVEVITSITSNSVAPASSSNPTPNPYHFTEFGHNKESNSNSSCDFSKTDTTTSQTYSSVLVQSESLSSSGSVTTQNQNQKLDTTRLGDEEEKGQQNQQSSCPRSNTSGSVSHSTSNSILLGSFSNNLSSPDTGYSTDGYSPKSVYPALSFESSGKSTPKSSYTISSLVSSELLHSSKHTTSLSSASCSVQNGLDLDHECISPLPASHTPQSESGRTDHRIDIVRNPKGDSLIERNQHAPSHSINYGTSMREKEELSPLTSSSQDSFRGNDTVNNKQYNSTSPSASYVNESSSMHNKNTMGVPTFRESMTNARNHSLDNENCKPGDFSGSSNPINIQNQNICNAHFPDNAISDYAINLQYSDKNYRPEDTDGRKSIEEASDGDGNSSSKLTGMNRNIRTSFVLASASQITECNPRLKNPFSICSPRKERTKIKTNPWITVNQLSNDGNSNANTEFNVEHQDAKQGNSIVPVSERTSMEKVTSFQNSKPMPLSQDNKNNNQKCTGVGKDRGNVNLKINKKNEIEGNNSRMDHQDTTSIVYRISTSTSASDSGKGSLEPGTNRNSTESSYLLSDSASARNSIISHEAEPEGSESRSRSSSSATDNFDNRPCSFSPSIEKDSVTAVQQSRASYHCETTKTTSTTGNGVAPITNLKNKSISSNKPSLVQFDSPNTTKSNHNNNSKLSEPKSEQDVTGTSTSITLPPELISTSGKTMVDKETDILSDWANTDDDGEDEIETDHNDNEGATPTPSTPDTDTGGRGIFPNSNSTSSATDIDFGDSSAATAASSMGIFPSSSVIRHHYTQNINKHSGGVASSMYDHHHNNIMNLPNTCYQPIQVMPKGEMGPREMFERNVESYFQNQSEPVVVTNHVLIQPNNLVTGINYESPDGGICNANIPLSALYSDPSIDSDYLNSNKQTSSNALARGALGFLRKIFKKGSCSSQRTSPGSDKVRIFRKGGKDNYHLPSTTGLRSPLLTDALVSHPLVNRKASFNGYFLTPTPNAFRRRSGTGTDSSDSKSSKHNHQKPVKTDIIRLPPGALSPTQKGHTASSSSTSSSGQTNIGAFCVSSLLNAYETGVDPFGNSNTNTNSTSASSSIHSMSTSVSATSAGLMANNSGNLNNKTPRQNQSRLNDNFYSNSNRQSPFMSNQQNVMSPILTKPSGAHSTMTMVQPTLHSGPGVVIQSYNSPSNNTSHNQISHQHHHHHHQRDFSPHPSNTAKLSGSGCPYESPRPQNPHRINSPSFNNYSPIHRLVVTGGNHLLTRGPNPTVQQHQQQQQHLIPVESISSHNPSMESPQLSSRHNNVSCHPTYNNNNLTTFTPIINRSVHHPNSTFSPLINHRQTISSPHHPRNSSCHPPPMQSFTSPSPILGNPRYQYIASSNQNSPILNVPKRINNTPLVSHQNHPYHNHEGTQIPPFHQPISHPNGPQPFSTFSPVPPPRQNANHNNPFLPASPNPNINNQQQYTPNLRDPRGSVGSEFENSNPANLQNVVVVGTNCNLPGSSSNRNNMLSRSQSYQTQQAHYYASPVIPQQALPHQQRMGPQPPQTILPSGLPLQEQPLLMRAHLHNQNIRLNNFIMNKQRFNQSNGSTAGNRHIRNSESFQERIYETVDSEDEDDENSDAISDVCVNNDDDDDIDDISIQHQSRYNQEDERNMQPKDFPHAQKNSNSQTQLNSKSKRSKQIPPSPPQFQNLGQSSRPPVPMALFGPNTFLSETETRLLEADREADRKYKRLINEAEALLREISAVKSQHQPWARRNHDLDRFQMEECPQSDPLRRKAYDCWALRRLQQELAGCCASPPVLHRSRMNLQSPSTPTGSSLPYFTPNLSVVQDQTQPIKFNDNNRNTGHF